MATRSRAASGWRLQLHQYGGRKPVPGAATTSPMAGPFSGAPSAYDGIGRLMTSSKSVRITAATLITVHRGADEDLAGLRRRDRHLGDLENLVAERPLRAGGQADFAVGMAGHARRLEGRCRPDGPGCLRPVGCARLMPGIQECHAVAGEHRCGPRAGLAAGFPQGLACCVDACLIGLLHRRR